MTQLLIETQNADFTAWKAAFAAEAENIDNAGLNQLQVWTADGGQILVLFEVVDRVDAEAWVKKQAALGHGLTARFLETA